METNCTKAPGHKILLFIWTFLSIKSSWAFSITTIKLADSMWYVKCLYYFNKNNYVLMLTMKTLNDRVYTFVSVYLNTNKCVFNLLIPKKLRNSKDETIPWMRIVWRLHNLFLMRNSKICLSWSYPCPSFLPKGTP